jgi:hypothetical protein
MEKFFEKAKKYSAIKITIQMGKPPVFEDSSNSIIESDSEVVGKQEFFSFAKNLLGSNLSTLKNTGKFSGLYKDYSYEATLVSGIVKIVFTLEDNKSEVASPAKKTEEGFNSGRLLNKCLVITSDEVLKKNCEKCCSFLKTSFVSLSVSSEIKDFLQRQLPKIVVIDERCQLEQNISDFFYNMSIEKRMNILLVYVSEKFVTQDLLQAFSLSVNLIVNIKDIEKIHEYISNELKRTESISSTLLTSFS